MNILNLPHYIIRCLLCTIIIELIIALILKVKNKKDILNIILINIVTNPLVVTIPTYMLVKYNYNTSIISLIILEILTLLVEGYTYLKVLEYKKINPFLLSLILNTSSYLLGEVINKL